MFIVLFMGASTLNWNSDHPNYLTDEYKFSQIFAFFLTVSQKNVICFSSKEKEKLGMTYNALLIN